MLYQKDNNYHNITGKMLEKALLLSKLGPVFPIWGITNGKCDCGNVRCEHPGKHPIGKLVPQGFKNATNDENKINNWFTEYPNANIGLVTGDDIIVLDVDGADGEATLDRLQSELGILPDTRTGKTGNGRHLYLQKSPEITITNSKPSDWKNIDVRSDGGYVVGPGSLHSSGVEYTFVDSSKPIAPLPESWVQALLNHQDKKPENPIGTVVLLSATDRSRPADEGERNLTLISYAGELECKNLSYDDIWTKLKLANSRYNPPETDEVVRGKVDSIWKYRMERVAKLEDLLEKLKIASKPERIKMIQDDEAKDVLRLCEATEPDKWFQIRNNLFKGCVQELKVAMKTHPILTLAPPSGNQMIEEIPGCPKTYPGDFEGFPTVDRYFFQQTGKGVGLFYCVKEDRQDEVCHTLAFITKRFVGDKHEAFLEAAWLEKGQWKYLKAPRSQFFNANKIMDLADRNFPVGTANAKALARYLQSFEATYIEMLPEQQISFQMGWHENTFLLGKECISSDSTNIDFQTADSGEVSIAEGLRAKGEYEKWLNVVNKVSNFPLPMIALYASLSTPLIKILEVPNYGVDFSGMTSTGKTTNLRLSASVYGQPDESLSSSMTRTWDSTNVAAERICELLSDLPMILDDTKRSKPWAVGSKIYMIISGQGRGRGSKAGLRETQSWRTTLISSGEAAAITYTTDAGARARLLTFRGSPFGDTANHELVNEVNSVIKNNYGHAGKIWIKWLIDNKNHWGSFREELEVIKSKFNPTTGVEARLAEQFAIIIFTSLKAKIALDIPNFSIMSNLRKIWGQIKEEAGEIDIHVRGARSIYEWAVSNPTSFWGQHKKDNNDNLIVPNNGWAGKWEQDENDDWDCIYFVPRQLEEICKRANFDYGAVTQGLIDSGLGSPGHSIRINEKRIKCFKIIKSALTGYNGDYPEEWDDDESDDDEPNPWSGQ
jgi:uncharacterized protein (DUF927 family)